MMKKILLLSALILMGCSNKDGHLLDVPNTGSDAFNDVTALNGVLYTTNYDFGEGAGPRIFLYRLSPLGDILDRYDVAMNGQGYIALTSNGHTLYGLCSTIPGFLVKWNSVGEILDERVFSWPRDWAPGGVVYDLTTDQLKVILYSMTDSVSATRVWELADSSVFTENSHDIDMGYTNPISAAVDPVNNLYILGEKSDGQRLIRQFSDYTFIAEYDLADSTLNGITWLDTSLIALSSDRYLQRIPTNGWIPAP